MRLALGDAPHGFLKPSLPPPPPPPNRLAWGGVYFLKRHLIGLLEAVPDNPGLPKIRH